MEKFENLNGKKVKIISTENGHGVPMGTVVTITASYPNNGFGGTATYYHSYNSSTVLYRKNFVLYSLTKEELQKELEETQKKASDIQAKIDFLNENNLENFDEDYFKVYSALQELDKDSSITEKVKVIINLIKG